MADTPPEIARIDALTATGRTNWFGLLGYLVFAYITVLAVEDADFFIDGRQTQLPLVDVAIPTISFFLFAPLLGTALYVYLHLHIRKVSEALTVEFDVENAMTLERRIKPWLLNDLILLRCGPGSIERRDLDRVSDIVTVALVWLAGSFVLGAIWSRSFVLHNLLLTELCGACLLLSIVVGCVSWRKMEQDTDAPRRFAQRDAVQMYARAVPMAILIGAYGAAATKGVMFRAATPLYAAAAERWNLSTTTPGWLTTRYFAAGPDLREARLSTLPPDQTDPVVSRAKYRGEWCRRVGHPPMICGTLASDRIAAPPVQKGERETWCAKRTPPLEPVPCAAYFAGKDTEFDSEWSDFRHAQIGALPKPDKRGRDDRNADLFGASLTGVAFRWAHMEGVNLSEAQM